ncbi:hypothetical protein BN1708_012427 [Verticillium longisporum]|uniref:Uncharacterized protein n=1 Tax=Verticillium longisporum TaxID=100787 RepID=A0A0G4L9K7_VERLO|nr:hypothetical protein BN1708_012427 [Verticillium longisporum]
MFFPSITKKYKYDLQPIPATPKAVAEPAPDGYGQYGGYGKYPPSKGGYGQYGGYGKYKKDLSELQDAKE